MSCHGIEYLRTTSWDSSQGTESMPGPCTLQHFNNLWSSQERTTWKNWLQSFLSRIMLSMTAALLGIEEWETRSITPSMRRVITHVTKQFTETPGIY